MSLHLGACERCGAPMGVWGCTRKCSATPTPPSASVEDDEEHGGWAIDKQAQPPLWPDEEASSRVTQLEAKVRTLAKENDRLHGFLLEMWYAGIDRGSFEDCRRILERFGKAYMGQA